MVSEEQIQRFFAKQCPAEEAEQVAAWLQAHPEEAAAYFTEADWQNASAGESMPEDIYRESWQQIYRKIKIRRRYILLQRSVVAACMAGCLAAGILYFNQKHKGSVSAFSHSVLPPVVQPSSVDSEWNLTNRTRRILLSDGSVVSLSPKSVVWFDTPFAQKNTRDIYLKGEARFEVAKNKAKPFTVYSGSFSTTALGTEFIVKEQAHDIQVQLMHGKVVIKNTDHSVRNWENIYLLPGQQMAYNDTTALAKVSLIGEKQTARLFKPLAKWNTQRETADSLIFNGSAMPVVLQKLHEYYNVQIQYAEADIKHISFTGVILKKDSVQTILQVISGMNGLSVGTTDSSFVITKKED